MVVYVLDKCLRGVRHYTTGPCLPHTLKLGAVIVEGNCEMHAYTGLCGLRRMGWVGM